MEQVIIITDSIVENKSRPRRCGHEPRTQCKVMQQLKTFGGNSTSPRRRNGNNKNTRAQGRTKYRRTFENLSGKLETGTKRCTTNMILTWPEL
eukprot:172921-Pyramimonas_sp.AAC.1